MKTHKIKKEDYATKKNIFYSINNYHIYKIPKCFRFKKIPLLLRDLKKMKQYYRDLEIKDYNNDSEKKEKFQ